MNNLAVILAVNIYSVYFIKRERLLIERITKCGLNLTNQMHVLVD